MAENRYDAKERHRRERRDSWRFDEDMRFNAGVDARDRRFREEQKQREDLRRQHLMVTQ
ncbi:MAG: hypothetical protein ACQCN6_08990 [Candidatus Bathyarchaeia archaeon]|jgi:hypothetical protein